MWLPPETSRDMNKPTAISHSSHQLQISDLEMGPLVAEELHVLLSQQIKICPSSAEGARSLQS